MKNQLFPTISEAFKNGTGDNFYSKDGKYLCISRNTPLTKVDALIKDGFEYIPYLQILELTKAERTTKTIEVKTPEPPKEIKRMSHINYSTSDWWMEEMPDGINQSL